MIATLSTFALRLGIVATLLALAAPAAGQLSASVRDGDGPVEGAMVTVRASTTGIETTLFSDAEGSAHFSGIAAGRYTAIAKMPGRRSSELSLEVSASAPVSAPFTLKPDPDYRERVPSSEWLALLPDGDMKLEFVLNCGSCHEIGHERVLREGVPRAEADWASAIALMRAIDVYGLTPPDFEDARYSRWLAEHLDADAIETLQPGPPVSGPALTARFTEYPVPKTPSLPHDLVLGPDGTVWITAFYNNVLWALDPDTGATRDFPVNRSPEVMGQVRALTFGPSGELWTLLGGTESLVRLDPSDGGFETFPVGMYPHSIEVDSTGRLWFNDYLSASRRIGNLDPENASVDIIEIPGAAMAEGAGLPLLYGLQVDAQDVVWGTMLAANKIFRYDPATGAAKTFPMPAHNSGPRRPGVAPDGSLWIPEFNTGTLTRFDPATEQFTRHSLGVSTLGLYDVAVDPRNGHVWAGASLGSSLIRYDPATGRRDVFPFPTQPAYPRHLAIDPETGDVWTTYSSMPDATPKIVRLELDGGAARRAAASIP